MISVAFILKFIVAAVGAGTPLLFGTVGEIMSEKVGHLNLGVEGMMAIGAVAGFAAGYATGNLAAAMAAALPTSAWHPPSAPATQALVVRLRPMAAAQ